MFYYAFSHKYSPIIRDVNNHRIGTVYRFTSKRDRDEWVSSTDYAETIDHKTARWYMLDYVASRECCAPSDLKLNTNELVRRYNMV